MQIFAISGGIFSMDILVFQVRRTGFSCVSRTDSRPSVSKLQIGRWGPARSHSLLIRMAEERGHL